MGKAIVASLKPSWLQWDPNGVFISDKMTVQAMDRISSVCKSFAVLPITHLRNSTIQMAVERIAHTMLFDLVRVNISMRSGPMSVSPSLAIQGHEITVDRWWEAATLYHIGMSSRLISQCVLTLVWPERSSFTVSCWHDPIVWSTCRSM